MPLLVRTAGIGVLVLRARPTAMGGPGAALR